jgi:hypothetical protein
MDSKKIDTTPSPLPFLTINPTETQNFNELKTVKSVESRSALDQNTCWVYRRIPPVKISSRSLVNCLRYQTVSKSLYESSEDLETKSKGVER